MATKRFIRHLDQETRFLRGELYAFDEDLRGNCYAKRRPYPDAGEKERLGEEGLGREDIDG